MDQGAAFTFFGCHAGSSQPGQDLVRFLLIGKHDGEMPHAERVGRRRRRAGAFSTC